MQVEVTATRTDEHALARLRDLMARGGRFVYFEYCLSCIAVTFRQSSAVYWIGPGRWAWVRGCPYTLLSLLFGWWGLPWGVIYTPVAVFTNLTGGRDISADMLAGIEKDPRGFAEVCRAAGMPVAQGDAGDRS